MTRPMNARDFWSGMILGLLGLLVLTGAVHMDVGSLARPDDGFMPLLVGAAMVMLSAGLAFRSFKRSSGSVQEMPFWPESGSPFRIGCILGAMLVYSFAFEWMGFAPATFALLLFLLRTIDPVPWKLALLMSFLATVLCVLLFQFWLQVQLPVGWLSGWRMARWIF